MFCSNCSGFSPTIHPFTYIFFYSRILTLPSFCLFSLFFLFSLPSFHFSFHLPSLLLFPAFHTFSSSSTLSINSRPSTHTHLSPSSPFPFFSLLLFHLHPSPYSLSYPSLTSFISTSLLILFHFHLSPSSLSPPSLSFSSIPLLLLLHLPLSPSSFSSSLTPSLQPEPLSIIQGNEQLVPQRSLVSVRRKDQLIEARVGLGEHVRVSSPARYLEGHLSHASYGNSVTPGGEEEEPLLLRDGHFVDNFPEPPEGREREKGR